MQIGNKANSKPFDLSKKFLQYYQLLLWFFWSWIQVYENIISQKMILYLKLVKIEKIKIKKVEFHSFSSWMDISWCKPQERFNCLYCSLCFALELRPTFRSPRRGSKDLLFRDSSCHRTISSEYVQEKSWKIDQNSSEFDQLCKIDFSIPDFSRPIFNQNRFQRNWFQSIKTDFEIHNNLHNYCFQKFVSWDWSQNPSY